MRCDELPGSVSIGWGTYTTTNDFGDATYSYYGDGDWHFTVDDTGGGANEFWKLHITYGPFNAHVWFEGGEPQDINWDRVGGANLPSLERQQFAALVRDNWDSLTAAAREFWNACTAAAAPAVAAAVPAVPVPTQTAYIDEVDGDTLVFAVSDGRSLVIERAVLEAAGNGTMALPDAAVWLKVVWGSREDVLPDTLFTDTG